MKRLIGLALFLNLFGKNYEKNQDSEIKGFKFFKSKTKLKRNAFLLIMVVIFASLGGLTFSRQSEAIITTEETAENLPLTALTPTPSPCIQPTAMPSPPPVLFRLSGKAIISRFNGGDVVNECSDFQDGQNIASPRGSFSLTNTNGGRNATMNWTADIGQLTGTFESVTNQFITRETDNNSKTENQVEIYVRGNFGTPYFLQFNSNGTASIQSSSNAPMLRYSAGIYDGFTNVAVGKPDLSATLPLQNSYTSPPNSTSSGACITVPEYPGVTYCRVYSNLNPYPIGSAIDANYSPITGGFNLNARGQLTVSYRAHINIGVPPTAIIEGPICEDEERTTVPVGLNLTFNSLSYDLDNNQPNQIGAGILKYDWKIRKPTGSEIPYENHSPTLNYTPDVEGNYVVTLKVTDDEGMITTITKDFEVVECEITSLEFEPLVSPIDENPNFSIPGGGNSGVGKRIFPDKPTINAPLNYALVKVKATTNCPCLQQTVFFRSFDVDDPSSDTQPLDTNPIYIGGDNRYIQNPRGRFIPSNSETASITTDSNGVAVVTFEVGMSPGDNYKIGASFQQLDLNLDELTDLTLNSEALEMLGGRIRFTRKLYVWRRLHIEVDSMGTVTTNHASGMLAPVTSPAPSNPQKLKLRKGIIQPETLILVASLDPNSQIINSRFNEGWIEITGVGGFEVTEIIDFNGNTFIKVIGNPVITQPRHFALYDDDNLDTSLLYDGDEGKDVPEPNLSFVKPLPNDNDNPNNNVFAWAYIRTVYNTVASENNGNVPFQLHVPVIPANLLEVVEPAHSSFQYGRDDFWVGYFLGAYQAEETADGDPEEQERPARGGTLADMNNNPTGGDLGCGSLIFLETIRDFPNPTNSTTAHELGHQLGILGHRVGDGIMQDGGATSNNELFFHPVHLSKLRYRVHSPSRPGSFQLCSLLKLNSVFSDSKKAVEPAMFLQQTQIKLSNFPELLLSGDLDTTFDFDGKAITDVNTGNYDFALATTIQSDGKIIVIGDTDNGTNTDFGIVRYNTDGSLDTFFGNGGKATFSFGTGFDFVNAVAVQTDGKIILAGYAENGGNLDFALMRLQADGTIDSAFGINGKVTTDIGGNEEQIVGLVLQTDGKIVVSGATDNGIHSDIALARYNSDGNLDTAFDTDGIVVTAFSNLNEYSSDIAIQSDGKIVITGEAENGANTDFFVARYETNGTLDAAFGANGRTITDFANSEDGATSLGLQTDGKIVVGGYTGNLLNPDFALARYNADGTIDTTFGTNGKTITDFVGNADFVNDIAIRSNGTIIAVGHSYNVANSDLAVAQYLSGGNLDATFGTNGKVMTPIGASDDFGIATAIQPDNKIVVAGASFNGANDDFAVARYLAAAPTAATVSVSGQVLKTNGIGISNATVKLTDSNGLPKTVRTNSFGYYRFEEVPVGETYLLEVRHKTFNFAPQIVTVNEDISDLNFIANEPFGSNFRTSDECLICGFEDSEQSSRFFRFR
jgi:uncharacterized delta-60 repeat protein